MRDRCAAVPLSLWCWQTAAFVAGFGMLAARGGAMLNAQLSGNTLKRLLGTFQLLIAPTMPLRDSLRRRSLEGELVKQEDRDPWARCLELGLIGIGSGFLAGLFGLGGSSLNCSGWCKRQWRLGRALVDRYSDWPCALHAIWASTIAWP
jgi:hypothetical protein